MANIVRYSSLDQDPLNRHYLNFQFKLWKTLFGSKPSRIIQDFGEYLEEGPDKQVDMGFRGLAKSYSTVGYGLYRLRKNPKEIVLCVSGEGKQAKGNADLAWQWMLGFDWLRHMRPTGALRQSAQAFDVHGGGGAKSENFAALSLFGSLTGRRASLIIPDDVETPNTAATETTRRELRTRYAELGGAILIDTEDHPGEIKVLGTPQTEDTIYNELALNQGYAMRIWPVLYPAEPEMIHYGPWLAPMIKKDLEANPSLAGTSTEPTRFSEKSLFKPGGRKDEYGLLGFRRQFLLWTDIGGADTKPLRLRDCPVVDIPAPSGGVALKVPSSVHWNTIKENRCTAFEVDALNGDSELFYPLSTTDFRDYWIPPESCVLMVDPSGSGKDETAWVVACELYGRIYVLEIKARLEGFTQGTMEAIALSAKRWGCHKIRLEKNFGGGMFAELLRPALLKVNHPCEIEEEFATGQKEVRIIDSLEGLVSEHRLVFNVAALQHDYEAINYAAVEDAKKRYYRLTYQFTRITREKGCLPHDDRLDALASLCAMFLGTLSRRVEEAENSARAWSMEEEMRRMIAERERQGLNIFGYGDGGIGHNGGPPLGGQPMRSADPRSNMVKSLAFRGRFR